MSGKGFKLKLHDGIIKYILLVLMLIAIIGFIIWLLLYKTLDGMRYPSFKVIRKDVNVITEHVNTTRNPEKVCVPQPECIRKKFPVLDQLKQGVIQPSKTQRTIYLKTWGRFGNNLYQLGGLLGLAKATCTTVKISSDLKLNETFKELPFEMISPQELERKKEMLADSYFDLMTANDSVVNTAIFATLKQNVFIRNSFYYFTWFEGCEEDFRRQLQIKDQFIDKAQKIIEDIKMQVKNEEGHKYVEQITTVGVHVRRTDRVKMSPQKSYYVKAMSHFRNKHKDLIFIVTTDDRKWLEENFPRSKFPDVHLAPENDFVVDFAILSLCNYTIQSVGSFSSWAAFFNGHDSVYYLACKKPGCDPRKSGIRNNWISMDN